MTGPAPAADPEAVTLSVRRPPGPPGPARAPGARRILTFAIAVLMVAAVLWAVLRTEGLTARAWMSMREAPPWLIAAALALPLANWLLVAGSFTLLTRRYGKVGAGEMASLIGAAWLLNYLPIRPGLFGRLAYHKTVNGIAFTDSARVLAIAILLTGAAQLTILLASAAQARLGLSGPAAAMGVGGLGLIAAALLARAGDDGWRFAAAYFLRLLDSLAWVLRYLVVYALVGQPVTPGQAAAIAAVSQIVLLIPVFGNGLGLRELAVGLAGASLPAWYAAGGRTLQATDGWAADLANRALELAIAIPVGLACTAIIAQRLARAPRGSAAAAPLPEPEHEAKMNPGAASGDWSAAERPPGLPAGTGDPP